jgi:hypothetical protein
MRLIDADAIEKFIEDGLNNPDKLNAFGHDAIEIMAEVHYAPTIDAVPVVRCADCAHRIYKDMGEEVGAIGGCELYNCATPNDHYCSFGTKVKAVLD